MLFQPGHIVGTGGALSVLSREDVMEALRRHLSGDWGDLSTEDKQENDFAVNNELRILSSYSSKKGVKFWIITEADRSVTTVLLPEEY
jgi:hypothetical protein